MFLESKNNRQSSLGSKVYVHTYYDSFQVWVGLVNFCNLKNSLGIESPSALVWRGAALAVSHWPSVVPGGFPRQPPPVVFFTSLILGSLPAPGTG